MYPLILNLGNKGELLALSLDEEQVLSVEQDAEWTSETVWTFWRETHFGEEHILEKTHFGEEHILERNTFW